MKNTNNTKKENTVKKENKVMKKSVDKAVKTAKVDTVKETKTEEVKENKSKKAVVLSADVIMQMYEEAGIKCYNPTAKGNYRIMGCKTGSSLNWGTYGFRIFSTDVDFKAVEEAKIEGVSAMSGANSTDRVRPNTVEIKAVEVLKKVLGIYAQNTVNALAK